MKTFDSDNRQITNGSSPSRVLGRRAFLGRMATGAPLLAPGACLLAARGPSHPPGPPHLKKGDAALLRFPAALEILEADFWIQYNELGGIQDPEVPGGTGNPLYTAALAVLDADMPQYIHDNTDDEITHFTFLNAGTEAVRTIPTSIQRSFSP